MSLEDHLYQTASEIRLSVGRFCYLLVVFNPHPANSLTQYYKDFIIPSQEPDVIVQLHLTSEDRHFIQVKSNHDTYKLYFRYDNGYLEAYYNQEDKHFKVFLKESIFEGINFRLLDKFFCQLYYLLLRHDDIGYIVHASGVVHKGKGYLFTGRSGSGKSTIASLAYSNDIVLNDEIVIVEKINDDFYIRSTPFAGNSMQRQNSSAPLRGVFLLKHDKENFVKPLKKIDFVRMFSREIGYPRTDPLFKINITRSRVIDFCERIFDSLPVYQLCFRPEMSVWKVIDEVT